MSKIVSGRKISLAELKQLSVDSRDSLLEAAQSVGREVIVYLHWSAGHYHQLYDDYHINIDDDGSIYVVTDDLSTVLSHTWHRNTGGIGISLACGAFCIPTDLGKEPPTEAQIESMAQVIAVLSRALDLPINADRVMTHAEVANIDDYGPNTTWERWDLWFLYNGDAMGTGGDTLREKANYYLNLRELL